MPMNDSKPIQAASARELLAELALFARLPDAALDRLAASARVMRLHPDETLFTSGDACDGVYVIASGMVKPVVSSRHGMEKVLDILSRGQSLGEAFLFFDRPHTASAVAISETVALYVGRAALLHEVNANAALARNMLTRLAERVQRYASDLEADAVADGAGRLASFLLMEAGDPAMRGPAEVQLPVRKTVLASRLSMTREHLSRMLRRLKDEQFIEVRGLRVRINDVARLREFVQRAA